ncbi:hypothetical protein, partial [Klebsiella pneumoniae]|uniref:hypothetical protein n=1 Tax=Klebsiella pneumoniae TaxID=573 RepID=UPI00210C05DE
QLSTNQAQRVHRKRHSAIFYLSPFAQGNHQRERLRRKTEKARAVRKEKTRLKEKRGKGIKERQKRNVLKQNRTIEISGGK